MLKIIVTAASSLRYRAEKIYEQVKETKLFDKAIEELALCRAQ